jgi:hypothetical protein
MALENLCMYCVNATKSSAMGKDVQGPQWPGRGDSAEILVLKLRCNKLSAYIERRRIRIFKYIEIFI